MASPSSGHVRTSSIPFSPVPPPQSPQTIWQQSATPRTSFSTPMMLAQSESATTSEHGERVMGVRNSLRQEYQQQQQQHQQQLHSSLPPELQHPTPLRSVRASQLPVPLFSLFPAGDSDSEQLSMTSPVPTRHSSPPRLPPIPRTASSTIDRRPMSVDTSDGTGGEEDIAVFYSPPATTTQTRSSVDISSREGSTAGPSPETPVALSSPALFPSPPPPNHALPPLPSSAAKQAAARSPTAAHPARTFNPGWDLPFPSTQFAPPRPPRPRRPDEALMFNYSPEQVSPDMVAHSAEGSPLAGDAGAQGIETIQPENGATRLSSRPPRSDSYLEQEVDLGDMLAGVRPSITSNFLAPPLNVGPNRTRRSITPRNHAGSSQSRRKPAPKFIPSPSPSNIPPSPTTASRLSLGGFEALLAGRGGVGARAAPATGTEMDGVAQRGVLGSTIKENEPIESYAGNLAGIGSGANGGGKLKKVARGNNGSVFSPRLGLGLPAEAVQAREDRRLRDSSAVNKPLPSLGRSKDTEAMERSRGIGLGMKGSKRLREWDIDGLDHEALARHHGEGRPEPSWSDKLFQGEWFGGMTSAIKSIPKRPPTTSRAAANISNVAEKSVPTVNNSVSRSDPFLSRTADMNEYSARSQGIVRSPRLGENIDEFAPLPLANTPYTNRQIDNQSRGIRHLPASSTPTFPQASTAGQLLGLQGDQGLGVRRRSTAVRGKETSRNVNDLNEIIVVPSAAAVSVATYPEEAELLRETTFREERMNFSFMLYKGFFPRLIHLFYPIWLFAHLPATIFLDYNIIYTLAQLGSSPSLPSQPSDRTTTLLNISSFSVVSIPTIRSSTGWWVALAIYAACTALWAFGVVVWWEFGHGYLAKWTKRSARTPAGKIYRGRASFHYACLRSYSHFCFFFRIRQAAFRPNGPLRVEGSTVKDGFIETCSWYSQNWPTVLLLLPRTGLSLAVLFIFGSSNYGSSSSVTSASRDSAYFNSNGVLTGFAAGILLTNCAWAALRLIILFVATVGLFILGKSDSDRRPPVLHSPDDDLDPSSPIPEDEREFYRLAPNNWKVRRDRRIRKAIMLCSPRSPSMPNTGDRDLHGSKPSAFRPTKTQLPSRALERSTNIGRHGNAERDETDERIAEAKARKEEKRLAKLSLAKIDWSQLEDWNKEVEGPHSNADEDGSPNTSQVSARYPPILTYSAPTQVHEILPLQEPMQLVNSPFSFPSSNIASHHPEHGTPANEDITSGDRLGVHQLSRPPLVSAFTSSSSERPVSETLGVVAPSFLRNLSSEIPQSSGRNEDSSPTFANPIVDTSTPAHNVTRSTPPNQPIPSLGGSTAVGRVEDRRASATSTPSPREEALATLEGRSITPLGLFKEVQRSKEAEEIDASEERRLAALRRISEVTTNDGDRALSTWSRSTVPSSHINSATSLPLFRLSSFQPESKEASDLGLSRMHVKKHIYEDDGRGSGAIDDEKDVDVYHTASQLSSTGHDEPPSPGNTSDTFTQAKVGRNANSIKSADLSLRNDLDSPRVGTFGRRSGASMFVDDEKP